jgi:hypothetical protein
VSGFRGLGWIHSRLRGWRRRLLHQGSRAAVSELAIVYMYTMRQSLPYQSGLLIVELVAWDDGVVNIGEDLPVVFLLHRESTVECVVRNPSLGPYTCVFLRVDLR